MSNKNLFRKAVVKVPERSAFDKSFRNLFTTKCGTLTPILCDEVIPNTTVNLKLAFSATLPPLASETFMNVNLKAEAFFCPTRLLMMGYEKWLRGDVDISYASQANPPANPTNAKIHPPVITFDPSNSAHTPYYQPGSLADYLGFRANITSGPISVSAFPFLAYHLIWNDWYRQSLVQKSCFHEDYVTTGTWVPAAMKYKYPLEAATSSYSASPAATLADGVKFGALRQRNFGSDYFTSATPSAQYGAAQKVSMSLGSLGISSLAGTFTSNGGSITGDFSSENNLETLTWDEGTVQGTGAEFFASISNPQVNGNNDGTLTTSSSSVSFTIASLRAANSLQQFLERCNIPGTRLVEFVKAQYGANLKDSIAQRPVYLGSASFPVYSKGVYQTAADSNNGNNPFDSVGSRYGHAYSEGSSFIIDHYTAEEPGYIMVLVSLVPEVTYSGGVNRYLMRYTDVDSYAEMPNPILQNVGQQPIYFWEFDKQINDDDSFGVFGYVDRYADMMTRNNELHGLMRDGQSLESFALQRSGLSDGISSSFLEIPTNYMDQVTAVDSAISTYGVWIDSYLDYKCVMPLAPYSIPSLQDPAYEHGRSVVVNRGGNRID